MNKKIGFRAEYDQKLRTEDNQEKLLGCLLGNQMSDATAVETEHRENQWFDMQPV